MKILVFGATGLTGALVVDLALKQGNQVVVLTRDASKLSLRNPNLKVIEGSASSMPDIEAALDGVDAVIHCLGIGGKGQGSPTTVVSESVKATLDAMKKKGVRRIVCMSNAIIEDKNRMEAALNSSSSDWVSVRLPDIVSGPSKKIRSSQDGKGIGNSITAESTAEFLLQQVSEDLWLRKTPSISN